MSVVGQMMYPPARPRYRDGLSNRMERLSQGIAPGGNGSDIGALEVDSLFRILSITKSSSSARVKFKTDPGNTYRLQQTSVVTNRVWTNIVGTVTGNGQNLEATDFGPLPSLRFYRVRAD